jgi:hypothetical protein
MDILKNEHKQGKITTFNKKLSIEKRLFEQMSKVTALRPVKTPHKPNRPIQTEKVDCSTTVSQIKRKLKETYDQDNTSKRLKVDPTLKNIANNCDLVGRIHAFINKHNKIRQHTPEWEALLPYTFGGTDTRRLSKPETRKTLINQKRSAIEAFYKGITLPKPKKLQVIAMIWGTIFEEVARTYAGYRYQTKIYGHDICIVNLDLLSRNSPDGFGIPYGKESVLFEFKCPYTRTFDDGVIPKDYEMQVLAGLAATEEITSRGIFMAAIIRKCRLCQLGYTPIYDRSYHNTDDSKYGLPKAWGIVDVYSKEKGKFIDYGAADKDTFEDMLRCVGREELVTSLVYLELPDYKPGCLAEQNHENMHLVGCIPFKIMDVVEKNILPRPNFKMQMESWLTECVNDVTKNLDVKTI